MKKELIESPLGNISNYHYRIDKNLINKIATTRSILAEFNAKVNELPDYGAIFLSVLSNKEAKESSEIESIFTTSDELFEIDDNLLSAHAKEVKNYANAILQAWEKMTHNNPITLNLIEEINSTIHSKTPGFRSLSGTKIGDSNGNIVHVPPQSKEKITSLMQELESYINNPNLDDDPLISMALIHYHFEKIHPFYDGNGRTGRILNILFLMDKNLISSPILYLSSYIIKHKQDYYRLLENTISSDSTDFYEWIIFILNAVKQTSKDTLNKVNLIKTTLDTIYSNFYIKHSYIKRPRDLLNHVFVFPITSIKNLMANCKIKDRKTATKYLEALVEEGILTKNTSNKEIRYTNHRLIEIFDM